MKFTYNIAFLIFLSACAMSDSPSTSLLTFPTDFPIKIMGINSPSFLSVVTELIQEFFPDFSDHQFEKRFSSGEKYLSLTCTLHVLSQEQLDSVYQRLSGHSDIMMVL